MKKTSQPEILWVSICEAKPNPLFTESQRQSMRFLIYSQPVACADCGKKTKKMWTMLCAFKSFTPMQFTLSPGKPFPPLTPVCDEHPLGPDWPEKKPKVKQK